MFDSQRLKRAVMNLVPNAIQATAPGGAIHVALARTAEAVRPTVHDAGPGLTDDQREHLFEAFCTTKTNGTGLGLAVSRELVASMGGELTHEHGQPGAKFLISLPVG